MVKICCPFIIPYLVNIFNSCILEGYYPEAWKRAIITPIPKTATPTEAKHLRPISTLPCLSKVLKKILSFQINNHLEKCDILPPLQSGFRSGFGCTTAMLKVNDDILTACDNGKITVLVLLDLTKAFDSIDHTILEAIFVGFDCTSVQLIQSYLTGRFFATKIGDTLSESTAVVKGVLQGFILAPLLFIIYTNHIYIVTFF